MNILSLLFFLIIVSSAVAQDDFTLTIHEISDPDGFNPLTSTNANALYMQENIFSRLLEYNRTNQQLEPALAVQRPIIKPITAGKFKGGFTLEYEIRPEAIWDNGQPITGEDYVFTVKVLKFKQVKNIEAVRPYFEFIGDILVDKDNPKKFTIYTKEPYFRAEESSGQETFVLPEYHYDAAKALRKISIPKLDAIKKTTDKDLLAFVENFDRTEYDNDKDYIVGSGPYKLTAWTRGNNPYVKLERKTDWWGDKVKNCEYLKAYPKILLYKIIPDYDKAIDLLQKGKIDIIRSVQPDDFLKLQQDERFSAVAEFHAVNQFAYHYLGFNTKLPKLADVRVRQAIAYAVDRAYMVKYIFNGYASYTNTPISSSKHYYNKDIQQIDFDLNKSAQLLDEAGWKDLDSNGVREKIIEGEKVELEIKILYNQGNFVRRDIAFTLKQALQEVGVNLVIDVADFPTVLDRSDNRDFEILVLAWVNTAGLDDPKQVWHSDSNKKGGSNRVGFNSKECDKLIEELRSCMDPAEQNRLYQEIQKLIVEQQPYVFLFVPKELIIIRKGFEYPELSAQRPGYVDRLFRKMGE